MAGPSTSDLPTSDSSTSLPPVYQFKISLIGPSSFIWRRIQVPMDYTFYAFHSAIQDAFGWNDIYRYSFRLFSKKPEVAPIILPETYESDIVIKAHFESEGEMAMYTYGPLWQLEILFEAIVERSVEGGGGGYPKCVDGERGCPPEPRVVIETDATNPHYCHVTRTTPEYSEDFNPQAVVFKDPRERFHNYILNRSPSTTL